MRVWLDDERPAPNGWTTCRWPDEVITLLKTGKVREISLDHDLGDDQRGTGYDVLKWLEEQVYRHGRKPPKISIHTANPAARSRMIRAKRQIYLLFLKRRSGRGQPLG